MLGDAIVGEARVAGARLARLLRGWGASGPLCVLGAGETTVTVTGAGRGGRNQELALGAAEVLAAPGPRCALLSGGTDGIDGPTDAAGAVVDSETCHHAEELGLDGPARFLAENDAYSFFHALSDLVVTGPTDTNVGDVQVLLRE